MNGLICIVFFAFLSGQPVKWALGPSLSPDAEYIAFSYHGDIWVAPTSGGLGLRLTSSPGIDVMPVWSPDGKWIVFSSNESGSSELYIIPSDGSGPPRRLTYHPAGEYPLSFSLDSKSIYFTSSMYDFRGGVYKISIYGGNPEKVFDFEVNNISAIDTLKFAIERGNETWYRRGYRGPAASELWIYDSRTNSLERLTNNDLRDSRPMYSKSKGKLYFLSNRSGNNVTNLYSMDSTGNDIRQLTSFTEEVNWASISSDGRKIVLESLGELYMYDTEKDLILKPEIRVVDDFDPGKEIVFDLEGNVTDFALSPRGDELAFVALGDVFVMCLDTASIKYGEIVRITKTPEPEANLTWAPDGTSLYYSSLRDGNYNIYKSSPGSSERLYKEHFIIEELIVSDAGTDVKPQVSPDGRKLAFIKDRGKLFVKDLKSGEVFRIGAHNDVLWFSWSPDSRWIAYSRTEIGPREDIYLVQAKRGVVPVNISNHPNDDYKPEWTRDGKRIFFASRNYEGDWWIKYAFLSDETYRNREEFLKEVKETNALKDSLRIDFHGLRERTITVYRFRAYYNYYTISPNGLYIAVQAEDLNGNDLWVVDHEGKNPRRITTSSMKPKKIEFSSDGKFLAFLTEDGRIYTAQVEGSGFRELHLKGKISLGYRFLYSSLMLEGWWLIRDGFYDEKMHGTDWEKMLSKYREFIPFVKTYPEFNNLVSRMLGELNASHLGIWQEREEGEKFGDLGIIIDETYSGGVRIKAVIKNSPAFYAGLNPGDIIKAVEDVEVSDTIQFGYYLRDRENKETYITFLKGSPKGRIQKILVKPASYWSIRYLIYESWVEGNRKYVDSVSSGNFAYIHVRGMGDQNYLEFEKDIYENRDKKGLILDIRYNGGGHIHDELLNFLRRTHYLVERERDGLPEFNSLFRWDRPVVLVINQFCFSDAEIFPAGFRNLNLGRIVGVPTFGGVIGTNDFTLFDGKTVFRQPSEGWFYDTLGRSLENTPVEPDEYVEDSVFEDNYPASTQLRRAIEVLQKILKD